MKVVVTYTREAELQFVHRVRSLPGRREVAQEFAIAYLEQIRDRLIETRGHPPDEVRADAPEPPHFRIPFINGIWIEYTVEDRSRWFWRTTRTITIVGFPVARE